MLVRKAPQTNAQWAGVGERRVYPPHLVPNLPQATTYYLIPPSHPEAPLTRFPHPTNRTPTLHRINNPPPPRAPPSTQNQASTAPALPRRRPSAAAATRIAPELDLTSYGLGFRVWGLGFRVQGLGFRV